MQTILFVDQNLFLVFNHLPHPAILNLFFELVSGVGMAGIIWFVIAGILFLKEEKKDQWFLWPVLLSGGVSYLLIEKVIKPVVARPRPSIDVGAILVGAVSAKDDFSFPSGHAAIAWAMAVVLSKKEPRLKWLFYSLAILISFSRVYLGRHFPLDVIAGGLLGWGIGSCSVIIGAWLRSTLGSSGRRRRMLKLPS